MATEDTPLPAHNIGHRYAAPHPTPPPQGLATQCHCWGRRRLLRKMGWTLGTGLGKRASGITEPIKAIGNLGSAGLGVAARDAEVNGKVAKERRKLAIEKEASGHPEVLEKIKKVQEEAERKEQTINTQNRPFYCALCDKQCASCELAACSCSCFMSHAPRYRQEHHGNAGSPELLYVCLHLCGCPPAAHARVLVASMPPPVR